jgi:hypothetical protein
LVKSEDCPRWTYEQWRSTDKLHAIQCEVVTLFPDTDCLLLLATFKNASFQKVRIGPRLEACQALDKADYLGKYEPSAGVFTLKADRGKLFSRKVVETLALVAGGPGNKAAFSSGGADKDPFLDNTERLVSNAFSLTVSAQIKVLAPGASLRFPVLVSFDADAAAARARVRDAWKNWASPVAVAWNEARKRTSRTLANLPAAPEKSRKELAHRACWTLINSEYGKRGELTFPMFSAAKGFRDDFFSVDMPLAALGFAELDWGKAEDALLQLSSFAAAAPIPIPPYTGEGLLFWEAGGMPWTGFAAFDLYLRDFDRKRAKEFFGKWAPRFAHESQWWAARTGDAFNYGQKDEEPWRPLRLKAARSLTPLASGEGNSDVGLTSLVAWQLQAGSAVEQALGDTPAASALQERAETLAQGLLRLAWDQKLAAYQGGLEGFFPFLLGVDRNLGRARQALEGRLLSEAYFPKDREVLPFAEQGVFQPWKAYLAIKTLFQFGYRGQADEAAERVLKILSRPKALYGAYTAAGEPLEMPGDASTAAVLLELMLKRHEVEAFLLPDTKSISGHAREIKAPDGSFDLEMFTALGKGVLSELSVASPKGGAILEEGAFVLSASKAGKLSFVSAAPVDVSELKNEHELFKGTKNGSLLVKKQVRYLFKFNKQ